MSLLKDKKILLTGVLSNRSIAYGIAKACHREGAQLAFTYQNERFLDRIFPCLCTPYYAGGGSGVTHRRGSAPQRRCRRCIAGGRSRRQIHC